MGPILGRMPGETIWLVGMMGAGKSAVGARLAERLGVAFVDTDEEVERSAGATIAQLFQREGESGFRTRERAAVAAVAGRRAVVALGGGAVAQPGMTERLAATGVSIWLRARPETLAARVAAEAAERPLLQGLDEKERRERLAKLLGEREPHYAAATLVVDTDALAPEAVAEQLARRLAERTR